MADIIYRIQLGRNQGRPSLMPELKVLPKDTMSRQLSKFLESLAIVHQRLDVELWKPSGEFFNFICSKKADVYESRPIKSWLPSQRSTQPSCSKFDKNFRTAQECGRASDSSRFSHQNSQQRLGKSFCLHPVVDGGRDQRSAACQGFPEKVPKNISYEQWGAVSYDLSFPVI